jgi:predicted DNA binding CopG/RHH family protein
MIEQKTQKYHIYYKDFPQYRTMVEVYKGIVNYQDIIKFKNFQHEAKIFRPDFNGILVLKDVDLRLTVEDLEKYKQHMSLKKGHYQKRFSAILTQTPNQVVVSMLYMHKLHKNPVQFETFSTLEACLNWINFPIDKKDVIKDFIDFASC